jgi:hypothetical protein
MDTRVKSGQVGPGQQAQVMTISVRSGRHDWVQSLVEAKCDAQQAARLATQYDDVVLLEWLLAHGASALIGPDTLLHYAAEMASEKTLHLLLQTSEVLAQNVKQQTAAQVAEEILRNLPREIEDAKTSCGYKPADPKKAAILSQKLVTLERVFPLLRRATQTRIKELAIPRAVPIVVWTSAFQAAVWLEEPRPTILRLFDRQNDLEKRRALFCAKARDQAEMVRLLLDLNVSPIANDEFGSLLHSLRSSQNSRPLVRMLMARQEIDPLAIDADGQTAWQKISEWAPHCALIPDLRRGEGRAVVQVITERESAPDAAVAWGGNAVLCSLSLPDGGQAVTPSREVVALASAARLGRVDWARKLLRYVDVNSVCVRQTALLSAVAHDQPSMVEFLLSEGAVPLAAAKDENSWEREKTQPFHVALAKKSWDIVHMLLAAGFSKGPSHENRMIWHGGGFSWATTRHHLSVFLPTRPLGIVWLFLVDTLEPEVAATDVLLEYVLALVSYERLGARFRVLVSPTILPCSASVIR